MNAFHAKVNGLCLVYRLALQDDRTLEDIRKIFKANREAPDPVMLSTAAASSTSDFNEHLKAFRKALSDSRISGSLSFGLKFQLHRLVQNCVLTSRLALQLLQALVALGKDFDDISLAEGVRA